MSQTTHPRNLVGDARIILDSQYDELVGIVGAVEQIQRSCAHILRRAAASHRVKREADSLLHEAGHAIDRPAPWNGHERRRQGHIEAVA